MPAGCRRVSYAALALMAAALLSFAASPAAAAADPVTIAVKVGYSGFV
jgi:ABC-type sugar transport system substrate-binding protein